MPINIKLKTAIIKQYGSQIAFAAALGVHDSLLSRIVRGWHQPTEELRNLICKKLGVKEHEIFSNN